MTAFARLVYFTEARMHGFDVVVGMGANLGDRLQTLRNARIAIASILGVRLMAHSFIYESPALTLPDAEPGPDFLNGAIRVQYASSLESLLDALLEIERSFGRVRDSKWGARTLDLDVLHVEGVVVEHERLRAPHPHLRERDFALMPLLDVFPGAIDPRTGRTYEWAEGGAPQGSSALRLAATF